MWWGKIIGFWIGYMLAGWVGAIIGLTLGHISDVYRRHPLLASFRAAHSSVTQMRRIFFEATFLIMGHIAKADGHISEQELNAARMIMQRMDLNDAQKKEAMQLFTQGKNGEFDLEATLARFTQASRGNFILLQMFCDLQLQAVRMSGTISPEKQKALQDILQQLGIGVHDQSADDFHGYQQHTHQRFGQPHSADKLANAYKLLGVTPEMSNAEIKRTYRRLMSQHHPDKLISKGLPEEMLKLATEKAQDIQQAYDWVREARGF